MRKIFFTAVVFLLPTLLQAQENKLYGEQYIKAIADNTRLTWPGCSKTAFPTP